MIYEDSWLDSNSLEIFKVKLYNILNDGALKPSEVKEIIYQGTAYQGLGRTKPFLDAVNEYFSGKGIRLPLGNHSTTTNHNRFEKCLEKQVELFGPQMGKVAHASPVNEMLATLNTINCINNAAK